MAYVKITPDLINQVCNASRGFYKSERDAIKLPEGLGDKLYELIIPKEDRDKMGSLDPEFFNTKSELRINIDNKTTALELSRNRPFFDAYNKSALYDVTLIRYDIHIPDAVKDKYSEIISSVLEYRAKQAAVDEAASHTEDTLRTLLGRYGSLQTLFKEGLKDKPEARELVWKLLPVWAKDRYQQPSPQKARATREKQEPLYIDLSNLTVQVVKKELLGV